MSRALIAAVAVAVAPMAACHQRATAPSSRSVDVVAPDGVVLKATLYPSAAAVGPGVLLLHQCDDHRTVWEPLGSRLAAAGITALAIDYRGYGDSGGTPHDKLTNEQQAAVTERAWPADFDAALTFLSRQAGVYANRLGAAGGSCGVANAIHLAERHNNVKALALLAGPADRAARAFLESSNAPPVFTAAAADDRYADFVMVSRWQFGLSPRKESRLAQYPDGGHAAVVFRTHPELADLLTRWFDAVLNGTPATLPVTNGRPLAPAVLQGLKTIDRPGGAAEVPSTPPLPEYIVNWLGYEHLAMKDTDTALAIMKLNAAAYPASANALDSLSDAYLAAGDTTSALTAAKRTLELLDRDSKDTADVKKALKASADAKIARLSAR